MDEWVLAGATRLPGRVCVKEAAPLRSSRPTATKTGEGFMGFYSGYSIHNAFCNARTGEELDSGVTLVRAANEASV